MTEPKELKIQFAPGCFDNFEGTQEELDEMVAEIKKMFEGKTPEELEAMSRPLNDDDLEELTDEDKEKIFGFLDNDDKRKLQ